VEQIWQDLFVVGIPIAEKIVRPILVYFFLIIGLRLSGKRELAQLNPFDLVVLLTLSNTVQNAIIGDDTSVTGGLIGATTLLGINYLVARVVFSRPRLERLVEGDEVVLIEGGQIQQDRLKEELLTEAELASAARRQGIAALDHIDRAVLEMGGAITFQPKEPLPEAVRHSEILARLDRLGGELAALQRQAKA
jgi:uncharacterized membrane protein YcaP (DUF421 family)